MSVPIEFLKLTRGFHQGVDQVAQSIEDVIDIAMSFIEPKDAPAAKAYLDKILGGEIDPKAIQKIWNSTRAEIYFQSDTDLLTVLELLRTRLALLTP